MTEQKNSMAHSNSQFSPNSTLFPLSSIESYDSGSARSQVRQGLYCCVFSMFS